MDSQSIGRITVATPAPQAPARSEAADVVKPADEGKAKGRAEASRPVPVVQGAPLRDPRSLHYQVDGGTNRIIATIVDDGSRTVVRQIPDAELLRIAQAIDLMQGFLVVDKA